MKKVEIICGTYGYRDPNTGRVRPVSIGNTVVVADEEAFRLIRLGVAQYVCTEHPSPTIATPAPGISDTGAGEDKADADGGAEGDDSVEAGVDADTLDIVDGHFTVESLIKLTRKNMEVLAVDLEIDLETIKKCQNKTELAELIASVEVEAEDEDDHSDGSEPPCLSPEDPVE